MTALEIIGIIVGIFILIIVLSLVFGWDIVSAIGAFFEALADAISDMDFDDWD